MPVASPLKHQIHQGLSERAVNRADWALGQAPSRRSPRRWTGPHSRLGTRPGV